jgi:hypothetical protein
LNFALYLLLFPNKIPEIISISPAIVESPIGSWRKIEIKTSDRKGER